MPNYTGHPLVDIGLAALTAFARKSHPQQLSNADLENAATWMSTAYTTPGPLRRFLRSVFFNAAYFSDKSPAIRQDFVRRVLYGWMAETPPLSDSQCAFCGQPAVYRANREEVPLLNGRGVFNFGAAGQAGIPICGTCSLALQALPLGCVRISGKLFGIHSDDHDLMLHFVGKAVRELLISLSLADESDDGKLPMLAYERTRFAELLVSWLAVRERRSRSLAISVTAYAFTNDGRKPSVRIYALNALIITWLDDVLHHADSSLTDAWVQAVSRCWQADTGGDSAPELGRNDLYEALLNVMDMPSSFLRKYLFPVRHFELAALYAERIMQMDKDELELIRLIGQRCTAYAQRRRSFIYAFSRENYYAAWRRAVLSAADDSLRRYNTALITFDEFVQLFTAPSGSYNDWRLNRDLITLYMIDQRVNVDDALFTEIEESLTDTSDAFDEEGA